MADELQANRFNIPTEVWNRMSDAERWEANKKFLDRAIGRGDEILLATPLNEVRQGSYYARELEYFYSQGYQVSEDGTRLVRP